MLIGHSDSNGSEDKVITVSLWAILLFRWPVTLTRCQVTVHHNYFKNVNSRGPSFRFGTGQWVELIYLIHRYWPEAVAFITTTTKTWVTVSTPVKVPSFWWRTMSGRVPAQRLSTVPILVMHTPPETTLARAVLETLRWPDPSSRYLTPIVWLRPLPSNLRLSPELVHTWPFKREDGLPVYAL